MAEAYDPFSLEEEADYEPDLEDDQEEQAAPTEPASQPKEDVQDAALHTQKAAHTIDTTDTVSGGVKRVRNSADPEYAVGAVADSSFPPAEQSTDQGARTRKKSRSAPQITPSNEDEKWLWKTANGFIRQHLKKYRDDKTVKSTHEFDNLSKKLTQKVYEKEVKKGTLQLTIRDSKRIQKFVDGYFLKYSHYFNKKI